MKIRFYCILIAASIAVVTTAGLNASGDPASPMGDDGSLPGDTLVCDCVYVTMDENSDSVVTLTIPVSIRSDQPMRGVLLNLIVDSRFADYVDCTIPSIPDARISSTAVPVSAIDNGIVLGITFLNAEDVDFPVPLLPEQVDFQIHFKSNVTQPVTNHDLSSDAIEGPCVYAMILKSATGSEAVVLNCPPSSSHQER